MVAKLKESRSAWTDPDDAPEITDEWVEGAFKHDDGRIVKRGRGRPPLANKKIPVKVRYDQDVIEAFRESGKGWQTRMNEALRQFLAEHDVNELDRWQR